MSQVEVKHTFPSGKFLWDKIPPLNIYRGFYYIMSQSDIRLIVVSFSFTWWSWPQSISFSSYFTTPPPLASLPRSARAQQLQHKASLICSWEQPLTSVWLPVSERGRRGGASLSEKPFASIERPPGLCYHATAKSTHRHNIYTVTLFSACASKRKSQGAYSAGQRQKGGGCIHCVNGWPLTWTRGVKRLRKH